MLHVETEQEEGGHWIAEVVDLPGVLSYGDSRDDAVRRIQSLALHVLGDRLEHGETLPQLDGLFSTVEHLRRLISLAEEPIAAAAPGEVGPPLSRPLVVKQSHDHHACLHGF